MTDKLNAAAEVRRLRRVAAAARDILKGIDPDRIEIARRRRAESRGSGGMYWITNTRLVALADALSTAPPGETIAEFKRRNGVG